MLRMKLLAGAACLASLLSLSTADLKFSRVHFIDRNTTTGNWLFRSSLPITNGSFAYDELVGYMRKRAIEEAGAPLPGKFFLQDIGACLASICRDFPSTRKKLADFDNIFEQDHINIEKDFFEANPDKGMFTNWVLIGSVIPPQWVNATQRAQLVNDTKTLWAIDQLPTRLSTVRQWLATQYDQPRVMMWHCEAGCDRTGEISSAYYMTYQNYNVTGAFAKSTHDCGRPPNYFSAGAISWYCLWLEAHFGMKLGDCLSLPV